MKVNYLLRSITCGDLLTLIVYLVMNAVDIGKDHNQILWKWYYNMGIVAL